jgi:hypothetical protein
MHRSRLGQDEPLDRTRCPGAGIVLIGMHRFVFTHDRCCRGLSGAEQGWPARLSNRQIYQLHALGLSLSAFCPDTVPCPLTPWITYPFLVSSPYSVWCP